LLLLSEYILKFKLVFLPGFWEWRVPCKKWWIHLFPEDLYGRAPIHS